MIIKCPECELQVSDKAISCPHCGYPMEDSQTRRKKTKRKNKRRRLPNGFGQISEIKNRNLRNPFRVMVSIGKNQKGRPICKALKPQAYFSTYNEAYEALINYHKNPYDLDNSISVEDLYNKWFVEYSKKVKNTRAVQSAWAYCTDVYKMRVVDIRARHIKGCMYEGKAMRKGDIKEASPYVVSQIKSMFNMMLDYALEYEIVDRNYARSFQVDNTTRQEMTRTENPHIPFTDEEMDLLWNNVDNIDLVDVILIQCYTGWRPQEIGLIELEKVDLKNWTFTGGMKTASGVDRIVPIHSKIRKLVENRYKEAMNLNSVYLFNYNNKRNLKSSIDLTYVRYKNRFLKIRDELGLNPLHRPHDARVHFVTMAKKYGLDEYAIKYIVGHSINDVTEKVYTHREITWLKDEIEKIK